VVRPVLVRHLVCVSHPRRPMPAAAARLVEVLVRHLRQRDHVPRP
jgi:LysR family nitrogen assimilation transcriptional regulator